MRGPLLILLAIFVDLASTQSTSDSISSSTSSYISTSTYATNSSPSSSAASTSSSSSSKYGSSESTATSESSGTSGTTNKIDSTTSDSLNPDEDSEKLVAYTTKQKTVFIACCGGTFVLLIALAILSGMSDTIARSRQKTKRTHA